ncbi:hypothetical protein F5Y08DRAFT_351128 [Xylaria arbuscula]|nr:hypothetical protein F5Y08DRAFT_351128 [Xylaria arbuscula]
MARRRGRKRADPDSDTRKHYDSFTVVKAGPRSFLYFVVANVGPGNSHRPLAITLRLGNSCVPDPYIQNCSRERANQVVEDCVRIFDIFTEPSNRTALEAELGLAKGWYQGPDYRAPDRVEVPDIPQPLCNFDLSTPKRSELPELPWASGIREFPFISTCLRMALNRRGTRLQHVQEQPLGTVYTGNKFEYGMVVLDISDFDNVRYGIIGPMVKYMAWEDFWEQMRDRPAVVEEPRLRVPLTANEYMKKFPRCDESESLKALNGRPLVSLNALTYIWPASDIPSDDSQSSGTSGASTRELRSDARLDQSIEGLMERVERGDGLDTSITQQLLLHPKFQNRLLKRLRRTPLVLGGVGSSADILRLAYVGHSHLNWVSYGNLTYESIAAALQSRHLKDATALSLCIDHLGGSPKALFDALVNLKSILEINFLQKPTRDNDKLCSQLFAQLCAFPSGSTLFKDKKLFFSSAYSVPLQRKPWFPDIANRRIDRALSFTPPIRAFPVQHMFVRQQFVETEDPKIFRPCYFFLGDALLDPERFAVGFLEYCCSVLTDDHLFSFPCCSPSISAHRNRRNSANLGISPIAAENFAIQRRLDVVPLSSRNASETQFECWPLVRDFEAGSWTVLVSHEWYVSSEDRKKPRPVTPLLGYESEVPYIRYAFIHTRRRIEINDEAILPPTLIEEMSGPNYVKVVGGLVEFLQETAALDDSALIKELLEDRISILKGRWPTELPPEMEYLSVLEEKDARAVFGDFLKNAAADRENLRSAMEIMPEEDKWYPDLLRKDDSQVSRPSVQRPAVFKPLPALKAGDPNPLGTEAKQWPEDDDWDL